MGESSCVSLTLLSEHPTREAEAGLCPLLSHLRDQQSWATWCCHDNHTLSSSLLNRPDCEMSIKSWGCLFRRQVAAWRHLCIFVPKCLRLVTCVRTSPCALHQPVSRGGVWLTWFLSDDTLKFTVPQGRVDGGHRKPQTMHRPCVRHRVFQQVLPDSEALCLLGCAVFRDLVATAAEVARV